MSLKQNDDWFTSLYEEAREAVESGEYEKAEAIAESLADHGFSSAANNILNDIELEQAEDRMTAEVEALADCV